MFLGNRAPNSENLCFFLHFQKDYVQSFPTCETYVTMYNSFPVGTMTSADFSALPTRDYRDLPR